MGKYDKILNTAMAIDEEKRKRIISVPQPVSVSDDIRSSLYGKVRESALEQRSEKAARLQELLDRAKIERRQSSARERYAARDSELTNAMTAFNMADLYGSQDERIAAAEQVEKAYDNSFDRAVAKAESKLEQAKRQNENNKSRAISAAGVRAEQLKHSQDLAQPKQELEAARAAQYYHNQNKTVAAIEEDIKNSPEYFAALNEVQQEGNTSGGNIHERGMVQGTYGQRKIDAVTDEQKAVQRVLEQRGDTEKLADYNEYLSQTTNKQLAEEDYEKLQNSGKAAQLLGYLGGGLGGAASWGATGVESIRRALGGEYRPIDTNSEWYSGSRVQAQAEEELLKDIDSPAARWFAQAGLSLADMAVKLPFGPVGMMAAFGAETAGNVAYDSLQRGATPDQAFANGTIAGLAEGLVSAIPVDRLFKVARGGASALLSKQGVKQVLQQAGLEANEELITQYAQTIADIATMGNKSNWALEYQDYIAQGYSDKEAKEMTNFDFFIKEPLLAAAAGGMMGGIMGAGATAKSGGFSNKSVQQADIEQLGQALDSVKEQNAGQMAELDIDPETTAETEQGQQAVDEQSQREMRMAADPEAYRREAKAAYNRGEINAIELAQIYDRINRITTAQKNTIQKETEVFSKEIDKLIIGKKNNRTELVVGSPPAILRNYGVSANNITISPSVVYKIAYPEGYMGGQHNLGFYAVKNILSQLSDPMAIAKSATQKNSLVFFTEFLNQHNQPVIIPLHLDKEGTLGISNVIPSAYGKKDFNQFIKNEREAGRIIYEKKGLDDLPTSGLQLPRAGNASDPMFKISQNDQSVNTPYVNNAAGNNGSVPPDGESITGGEATGNRPVSKVRTNTLENSGIYNEVEKSIEGLRQEDFEYDPITEKASMATANERLNADYEGEKSRLQNAEAWGATDLDEAMGILYSERQQARQTGDYSAVNEWSHLIQSKGTRSGQFIQAFAKYTRTPTGVLIKATDSIQTAQENGRISAEEGNRLIGEMEEFADLLENLQDGDFETLIDIIKRQAAERKTKVSQRSLDNMEKIRQMDDGFDFLKDFAIIQMGDIAEDYKKISLGQKISTVQTMAHLLNFATAGRNIVSNAVFNNLERVIKFPAALMDAAISCVTHKRSLRADSGIKNKSFKQGKKDAYAKAALQASLDVNIDKATSKYETGGPSTFKAKDHKILFAFEKAMAYELKVTDETVKGGIYNEIIHELAPLVEKGYYTLDQAVDVAVETAKYRTFQNETLPSRILKELKDLMNIVGIGHSEGNKVYAVVNKGKITERVIQSHDFGVGDLVQKYTKAPGALLTRIVEYSPTGYMKAIGHLSEMIKSKGENVYAQRQFALALTRAMTGTGLVMAFATLAKAGLLTRDDDEKNTNLKALKNAAGLIGTQLNISGLWRALSGGSTDLQDGDKLLSLDFLEPITGIMTIGFLLNAKEGNSVGDIATATLDGIYKSFKETPTMQSLETVSNIAKYHDEDSKIPILAEIPIEIASSSITGFVPGPVRQLGKFTDPVYRDTATKDSAGGQMLDKMVGSLPFLRKTLPEKTTGLGEVKTDNNDTLTRFLNAFFNPGAVNTYKENKTVNELERLFKNTGDASIIPARNGARSFTSEGNEYELNNKERYDFLKNDGKTYNSNLKALFKTSEYKNASDAEKLKMIAQANVNASDIAKEKFLSLQNITYTPSAKTTEYYEALKNAGLSSGEAFATLGGISYASAHRPDDIGSTAAKSEWLYKESSLTYEQKLKVAEIMDFKYDSWMAKRAKALNSGISEKEFSRMYSIVNTNVKKEEAIQNLINKYGYSYSTAAKYYSMLKNR